MSKYKKAPTKFKYQVDKVLMKHFYKDLSFQDNGSVLQGFFYSKIAVCLHALSYYKKINLSCPMCCYFFLLTTLTLIWMHV